MDKVENILLVFGPLCLTIFRLLTPSTLAHLFGKWKKAVFILWYTLSAFSGLIIFVIPLYLLRETRGAVELPRNRVTFFVTNNEYSDMYAVPIRKSWDEAIKRNLQ